MNRSIRSAVKEAFDNLPSGICFFDCNGIAALCNRQMRRLVFDLTGMDLQSLSDVRRIIDGQARNARLDNGVFLLGDGSAWRFSSTRVICADGSAYTQVVASDVTELYAGMSELEKDNRYLEELGARMRRFSADIIAVTREEEILAMKMRVHDDMGRSIIATRRLLKGGAPSSEFDLTVWKNAIQMLEHSGAAAESGDSFAMLAEAAQAIGVKLCLDGTLPNDAQALALLTAAIRECTTNAARHADATELYVKVGCDNGLAEARIANNGEIPQGKPAEGGGLTSLRAKLERSGGSMSIRCLPEFEMTVTIPIKKEEEL